MHPVPFLSGMKPEIAAEGEGRLLPGQAKVLPSLRLPVPRCGGESALRPGSPSDPPPHSSPQAHTEEVSPPQGCHLLKDPKVSPQRPRSQRNGPRDPEAPLPGVNSIQGCGCGLHPGRVVPIGSFSERAVPGGHAGECAKSTLCGASSNQRTFNLLFSARESTMAARAKGSKELFSRPQDTRGNHETTACLPPWHLQYRLFSPVPPLFLG
ncbi:uncharacterized protein LOC103102894 isoform X6 [Monodelphis domestica]|uniref:uncharacterized protein LOC103102894 isoform X6 n=1 Tax=Monodelphis domestica TaxID=13616 RepID=UPI0024E25F2C|nr:uncharacterized protein LOC103102894 isoform X6 [Monodelphis domestica]